MPHHRRLLGRSLALAALLMLIALAGCTSNSNGVSQKATAASSPRATGTADPDGTPAPGGIATSGATPSTTPTTLAACNGKLADVPVPLNAMQIGSTGTSGATISCMYRIPQDVQTLDTFFKTQMGSAGWTLLEDTTAGPAAMVQEYFHAQHFATIQLTQDSTDTHSTEVSISVESSQ